MRLKAIVQVLGYISVCSSFNLFDNLNSLNAASYRTNYLPQEKTESEFRNRIDNDKWRFRFKRNAQKILNKSVNNLHDEGDGKNETTMSVKNGNILSDSIPVFETAKRSLKLDNKENNVTNKQTINAENINITSQYLPFNNLQAYPFPYGQNAKTGQQYISQPQIAMPFFMQPQIIPQPIQQPLHTAYNNFTYENQHPQMQYYLPLQYADPALSQSPFQTKQVEEQNLHSMPTNVSTQWQPFLNENIVYNSSQWQPFVHDNSLYNPNPVNQFFQYPPIYAFPPVQAPPDYRNENLKELNYSLHNVQRDPIQTLSNVIDGNALSSNNINGNNYPEEVHKDEGEILSEETEAQDSNEIQDKNEYEYLRNKVDEAETGESSSSNIGRKTGIKEESVETEQEEIIANDLKDSKDNKNNWIKRSGNRISATKGINKNKQDTDRGKNKAVQQKFFERIKRINEQIAGVKNHEGKAQQEFQNQNQGNMQYLRPNFGNPILFKTPMPYQNLYQPNIPVQTVQPYYKQPIFQALAPQPYQKLALVQSNPFEQNPIQNRHIGKVNNQNMDNTYRNSEISLNNNYINNQLAINNLPPRNFQLQRNTYKLRYVKEFQSKWKPFYTRRPCDPDLEQCPEPAMGPMYTIKSWSDYKMKHVHDLRRPLLTIKWNSSETKGNLGILESQIIHFTGPPESFGRFHRKPVLGSHKEGSYGQPHRSWDPSQALNEWRSIPIKSTGGTPWKASFTEIPKVDINVPLNSINNDQNYNINFFGNKFPVITTKRKWFSYTGNVSFWDNFSWNKKETTNSTKNSIYGITTKPMQSFGSTNNDSTATGSSSTVIEQPRTTEKSNNIISTVNTYPSTERFTSETKHRTETIKSETKHRTETIKSSDKCFEVITDIIKVNESNKSTGFQLNGQSMLTQNFYGSIDSKKSRIKSVNRQELTQTKNRAHEISHYTKPPEAIKTAATMPIIKTLSKLSTISKANKFIEQIINRSPVIESSTTLISSSRDKLQHQEDNRKKEISRNNIDGSEKKTTMKLHPVTKGEVDVKKVEREKYVKEKYFKVKTPYGYINTIQFSCTIPSSNEHETLPKRIMRKRIENERYIKPMPSMHTATITYRSDIYNLLTRQSNRMFNVESAHRISSERSRFPPSSQSPFIHYTFQEQMPPMPTRLRQPPPTRRPRQPPPTRRLRQPPPTRGPRKPPPTRGPRQPPPTRRARQPPPTRRPRQPPPTKLTKQPLLTIESLQTQLFPTNLQSIPPLITRSEKISSQTGTQQVISTNMNKTITRLNKLTNILESALEPTSNNGESQISKHKRIVRSEREWRDACQFYDICPQELRNIRHPPKGEKFFRREMVDNAKTRTSRPTNSFDQNVYDGPLRTSTDGNILPFPTLSKDPLAEDPHTEWLPLLTNEKDEAWYKYGVVRGVKKYPLPLAFPQWHEWFLRHRHRTFRPRTFRTWTPHKYYLKDKEYLKIYGVTRKAENTDGKTQNEITTAEAVTIQTTRDPEFLPFHTHSKDPLAEHPRTEWIPLNEIYRVDERYGRMFGVMQGQKKYHVPLSFKDWHEYQMRNPDRTYPPRTYKTWTPHKHFLKDKEYLKIFGRTRRPDENESQESDGETKREKRLAAEEMERSDQNERPSNATHTGNGYRTFNISSYSRNDENLWYVDLLGGNFSKPFPYGTPLMNVTEPPYVSLYRNLFDKNETEAFSRMTNVTTRGLYMFPLFGRYPVYVGNQIRSSYNQFAPYTRMFNFPFFNGTLKRQYVFITQRPNGFRMSRPRIGVDENNPLLRFSPPNINATYIHYPENINVTTESSNTTSRPVIQQLLYAGLFTKDPPLRFLFNVTRPSYQWMLFGQTTNLTEAPEPTSETTQDGMKIENDGSEAPTETETPSTMRDNKNEHTTHITRKTRKKYTRKRKLISTERRKAN